MTDPATTMLYVGWTGHGNLGDDAIADALIPNLPAVQQQHVPHDPAGFARHVLGGGFRGASTRTLLVGGGTVIGRRNWRLLLTGAGALLARHRPWHLIGIGVEDPSFQGRNSFSDRDELARWADLCGRFDRITVRGPRSVRLLKAIGVHAELVGDPALLHRPTSVVDPRERLAGINLGFGDDLWGHDHERVVTAVAELIHELVTDRWDARLMVVNPKDEPLARECVRRAAVPAERVEIRSTLTVPDYLDAVAECTVLVAERLHALVLGAAAAVPLVGLEYQPKCADFLGSVDAENRSIRTDVVTSAVLREHVEELAARREAESRRLLGHVEDLRSLLWQEIEVIRSGLAPAAPVVSGAR